jgi:hypothetical protein
MFGSSGPSNQPGIKSEKSIGDLINSLGPKERTLWAMVPIEIQMEVRNKKLKLADALRIVLENTDKLVNNKIPSSIFKEDEAPTTLRDPKLLFEDEAPLTLREPDKFAKMIERIKFFKKFQ